MTSSGAGGRHVKTAPEVPVSGQANGAAAEEKWAICCSGGGIRSAAYCLGALQSLQDGILAKAKWILGVSGGSYIATSRALVARNLTATEAENDPAYAVMRSGHHMRHKCRPIKD